MEVIMKLNFFMEKYSKLEIINLPILPDKYESIFMMCLTLRMKRRNYRKFDLSFCVDLGRQS